MLEESAILEPLGREIENLPVPAGDHPVGLAGFRCREVRVHRNRAHALGR